MQQAAFWQDWQFWQVVVAAVAALLGFFGGTLATHALDRRRGRERERVAAASLATALHAEISAIRAKAGQLFGLIGQSSGVSVGAFEAGRALGIPRATVFEANAGQLGLLPADVCRVVIDFYGIRTAAEAVLNSADPLRRQVLLGWLLQAANSAPQSLMALDLLLKRPQQDYGMIAAEQTADLPVRNLQPAGRREATWSRLGVARPTPVRPIVDCRPQSSDRPTAVAMFSRRLVNHSSMMPQWTSLDANVDP